MVSQQLNLPISIPESQLDPSHYKTFSHLFPGKIAMFLRKINFSFFLTCNLPFLLTCNLPFLLTYILLFLLTYTLPFVPSVVSVQTLSPTAEAASAIATFVGCVNVNVTHLNLLIYST